MRKPIFWILLFALFLRLWGITYGLPFFLINDETPHVYGALKMIELKTLVPAFHPGEFKKVLYYPPLLSYFYLLTLSPVIVGHYILSGAPPLLQYKAMLALDPSFIWLAARFWMVLIGLADILVVYFLTRRMFQSERAALFAAIFLSLSFWHIQLSHNARHWLPAAFLISLLWYLAVKISIGAVSRKLYFFAGALAGMAAGGVNTAAAVGLIPPFLSHVFQEGGRRFWKRIFTKETILLLVVFVAVAAVFIILYPYGLTRAEGAQSAGQDILGRLAALANKDFVSWLKFLAAYLGAFWKYETPLFLVALLGMALAYRSGLRFWANSVLLFAIFLFSLIYLFDDFTARAVIFVLPILAVFAGYAADRVYEKLRNLEIKKLSQPSRQFLSFLISIFFFVLLFGWQLITDFRYQWLLAQKDTRLVARDWVLENIPSGAKIVMDAQYFRLTNTQDGIAEIQAIDPAALRAADKALLRLPPERYPHPAYGVLNLNFLSPEIRKRIVTDREFFRQRRFEYLIVEYASPDAMHEDTRGLMEEAKLLKRFSGWKMPQAVAYDGSGKINGISIAKLFDLVRFGLFVDIYELQNPKS